MANEYYAIIGVDPQASSEEIKRAYAKTRREVETQQDEEKLKTLLLAKTTLLDPKAREHYNSIQQYGEEITELQAQALQAMDDENWEEAIRLLKRLIVLAPTEHSAVNLLGISHLRHGYPAQAVKVFDKLVMSSSDTALYWMNNGYAYKELGDAAGYMDESGHICRRCAECGEEVSAPKKQSFSSVTCPNCGRLNSIYTEEAILLYERAKQRYNQALQLEPMNSEPYLELAKLCCKTDEFDEAVSWAEKGINADGKVDLSDLEDIFGLCIIYSLADRPNDIYNTVHRMLPLDDDEEYPKYLSWRFIQLAKADFDKYNYERSATWWQCANICIPNDDDIPGIVEYVLSVSGAASEWQQVKDDQLIIQPLRRRAIVKLMSQHTTEEDDSSELEQAATEILNDIDNYNAQAVVESINRITNKYPRTLDLDKDFYNSLKSGAQDVIKQLSAKAPNSSAASRSTSTSSSNSSSTSSTSDSSGCGCWALAICTLIGLGVGGPVGAIIGFILGLMICGAISK